MTRHFHQQFVKIHAYMHFKASTAFPPAPHLSSSALQPSLALFYKFIKPHVEGDQCLGLGVCVGPNEWQTKPGDDNTNCMQNSYFNRCKYATPTTTKAIDDDDDATQPVVHATTAATPMWYDELAARSGNGGNPCVCNCVCGEGQKQKPDHRDNKSIFTINSCPHHACSTVHSGYRL